MDTVRHEQFAKAFVQHQDRVYGYIVTLLPNRHDAEDVFQQTSLILWQKWEQFDPKKAKKGTVPLCAQHSESRSGKRGLSPFSSDEFLRWACGIARFEVRNFLRRKGRSRVVLNEHLMDELAELRNEELPLLTERRSLLADCMKKLDFVARELIERAYAGRESMDIIAQQFRTTPNALYLRMRKIRRELMECVNRGTGREESQ